jgi:hypothetical protein
MTAARPRRIVLGPQNPVANLPDAVESLALGNGRVAIISAGWQEGEGDVAVVSEAIGRSLFDLRLYRRAETVFGRDPALHECYRDRQSRLQAQQRLYRLRLKQLSLAARQIRSIEAGGDISADMIQAEQRHAIAQLRALDRHHLHRTEIAQEAFWASLEPSSKAIIEEHRRELRSELAGCSVVLITGGNVVVLLNRLRLFGMGELLADKPLVAWSAGAMTLAERVVLFHDRTPQGRRDAEVLGAGCGLLPGFVFLPDVRHRMNERNRNRIGLFCQRFAPDACLALDTGSSLRFDGTELTDARAVRQLRRKGKLTAVSLP